MAAWTYLRTAGTAPDNREALDIATVLLRARDYVPLLYPAVATARDFRAMPRRRGWLAVPTADAVVRLRHLGEQARGCAGLAALCEGCGPVATWLDEVAPRGLVILDLREAFAMAEGDPRPGFAETAELFARFAASPADADTAGAALRPDWMGSDPAQDAVAVCRWTRLDALRPAFFSVAFGWPDDPVALAERWQPWFASGPAAPAMTDPATDARRLREVLDSRGLARFSREPSRQPWIERYLIAALRERTAASLGAALQVMLGQGLVLDWKDDPPALSEALRALDRPR